MIKVPTYTCPNCRWTIYQRCKQDQHTCYCSAIRCDGKILDPSLVPNNDVIVEPLELDTNENKMLIDFNYNGVLYGSIKPIKINKENKQQKKK
jgi:hypothetical protein